MDKLITFAVPCYNSAAYMDHCVQTLLQGGDDIEIILVDDGSADGSGELVRRVRPGGFADSGDSSAQPRRQFRAKHGPGRGRGRLSLLCGCRRPGFGHNGFGNDRRFRGGRL